MSVLDTLVFDRTAADVERWRTLHEKGYDGMTEDERAEWAACVRGAYNAADLNRVTQAMEYLVSLYQQYERPITYTPINITHADGTTNTIWQLTDKPTDEQLALLLQNLLAFWKGVEEASMDVIEVWANTQFGYVDLDTQIVLGDYATIASAHGIQSIVVEVHSNTIENISLAGTGWVILQDDEGIAAHYINPHGPFQDLQDALDSLVFTCMAEDGAVDATVLISAVMRSGDTISLGMGKIHWSAIINWAALESYALTWADIEAANMTWDDLEHLPMPNGGGAG